MFQVKTIIWDFGKISNAESYEAFEKELKNATNGKKTPLINLTFHFNFSCYYLVRSIVTWFISGLDIGILVNNAAEFQQESLDMISVDRLFRASSVNSLTPALLARYFIPKMLARYNNVIKLFQISEKPNVVNFGKKIRKQNIVKTVHKCQDSNKKNMII